MTQKIFILIFIYLLLCSCTNSNTEHTKYHLQGHHKSTLRLNFYENISKIDPHQVNNDTEQLVCDLIYEPLIQSIDSGGVINSSFIKEIHTEEKKHIIKFNDRHFTSGKQVSTQYILNELKSKWENEFEKIEVSSFFSSIEGFPLSNWHRINRNDPSKFPTGIALINPNSLSISTRKNTSNLAQKLKKLQIIISDDHIGSSQYYLDKWKDDISCILRSKDSAYNDIHIRFIKNEDLKIKEFINGNFDIIKFQPSLTKSSKYKDYFNKEISSLYADYQIYKSNTALVNLVFIDNIDDSLTHSYIENIINSTTQIEIDNLYEKSLQDSLKLNNITLFIRFYL